MAIHKLEDIVKEYTVNNSVVRLRFGDVMQSDARVMVVSGSVGIPMIGGFPEIVKNKAGRLLQSDIEKHKDAGLGDVVVTSAGNLPYKYLFHAVTVSEWTKVKRHDMSENIDERRYDACNYILGHLYSKCMRLLTALDLDSIAFPCLGLGMGNMNIETVAEITARNICEFLGNTQKRLSIEFYMYSKEGTYSELDYISFFEWFSAYSHGQKGKNEIIIPFPPDPLPNPIDELDRIKANPHKVFFSYSRKDSEKAEAICRLLDTIGIPYWIDRNGVFSGSNFKELIVKAISATDIVLFLSSENSNSSENVTKEISIASEKHKIIIPVRLDASAMHPTIAYDLAGIDFLDLFSFDENSQAKLKNAILGQLAMNNSI